MIDELEACQNLTTNPENLSLYRTPSASVRVTEAARKEKHVVGTGPVTDQSSLHHKVSVPYLKVTIFVRTNVSGLGCTHKLLYTKHWNLSTLYYICAWIINI